MATADIVVIGGGVIGTSTAFQLARRRAGKVVLVERDTVGAGPTSRSIGIIRLHYSHAPLIALAARSLELFAQFEALTGHTADFVRSGFLLLASADQLPSLVANVELQRSLGVRAEVLTPADVARVEPRMHVGDLAGAAYEPESGYADGYATAAGFAAAARRLGVEVWESTPARRLITDGHRIAGVETARETIATPKVLVAAGPWTPPLLAPLGVAVPIESSRQQVVQLAPPPGFGRLGVVVEDMVQGFYARAESGDTVLAGVLEEEAEELVSPDAYRPRADFDFIERVGRMWAHRFPGAREAGVRGGYASLYDITPDWQPILGPVEGFEGLHIAAGFSGHGFKLSPALGEVLAAALLGEPGPVDVSSFSLARFATGALLRGRHPQGILG